MHLWIKLVLMNQNGTREMDPTAKRVIKDDLLYEEMLPDVAARTAGEIRIRV